METLTAEDLERLLKEYTNDRLLGDASPEELEFVAKIQRIIENMRA